MLRKATMNEIPVITQLIQHSVRMLCGRDYSNAVIESAIRFVFGVDTQLVEDQTYYVIECDGIIQACGGWSKRKTLFGGNQFGTRESGYLDPETDAAKIRAFFVHPDYARQGLGTRLLKHCEEEALANGFSKTEMVATLSGVRLYEKRGYVATSKIKQSLPDGVQLSFVHMNKSLVQYQHEPTPRMFRR